MKKFRSRQLAVLILTVMLLTLIVSVSASADTLWITQNLNPSLTVAPGETVTLTVAATGGDGPISFQWWSKAGMLVGSNSPSISFQAPADNEIWCVVSSGEWKISSTHCVITVNGGGITPLDPTAPVATPQIVTQPKSITVPLGQSGTLSVQATCAWQSAGVRLEYQWYSCPSNDMRYATPISGATSPTFTVPPVYSPSKLYYVCSVCSTNGMDKSQLVYSDVVTVYCGELNITKHPTGETVNPGGKATFIAKADGAAAFQWRIVRNDGSNNFYRADEAPSYINGLQVYGADTNTLVLSNIPASMNGMNVICVFYADAARTQFKITNSARITVNNPNPTPTPVSSSYIPGASPSPAVTVAPMANATILTPTISVQPEGAVLEQGQNTSLAVVAVDDNTSGTQLKYQWYKNDKNSNTSGTAIAGAQSASYVPETTIGSKYYYVGVWATDGSKTSKVVYSSPVAVTYNTTVTPAPTATPAPVRGSDKSLLSQLALPLIAMLVAAAVGIGAFIVLKKTNSEGGNYNDRDYDRDFDRDRDRNRDRGGRGQSRRNYNDRYDDYDD